MELPRMGKNLPQREPAPEFALGVIECSGCFDVGAGGFKHRAILNSGRAGCDAGKASQTLIHFIAEAFADWQLAAIYRANQ